MLSNSLKRLSRTNRLITVDDISDSLLAGRSAAHSQCWKYLQQSSYDAALQYAEQIIIREPEKPDGYIFKARALFQKGRYQEAEEVLLQVMKIAEDNDLIRSDVEAFVKLKYELAAVRKEILKALDVVNVKDIVKKHIMDFEASIVELHSRSGASSKSSSPQKPGDVVQCEPDLKVVHDLEVAPDLLVVPDLEFVPNVEFGHDSDSYDTYESGDECDSYRTPLYTNDFGAEEVGAEDVDERMVTISRIEYFRLKDSDKKCLEYEEKIHNLEEELKKVYLNTISIITARKEAEKEAQRLRSELDRMANTVRYVEEKEDEFENRYFFGINPMKNNLKKNSNKKTDETQPKMISINKIHTKVTEVKSEPPPPTNQNTVRNIFHNNKGVPKVDN